VNAANSAELTQDVIDRILALLPEQFIGTYSADSLLNQVKAEYTEVDRKIALAFILRVAAEARSQYRFPDGTVRYQAAENAVQFFPCALEQDKSPLTNPPTGWLQRFQDNRRKILNNLVIYRPTVFSMLSAWDQFGTNVRILNSTDILRGAVNLLENGDASAKLAVLGEGGSKALSISEYKSILTVQSERSRESLMNQWYGILLVKFLST
jgi:hypothetical protein